MDLLKKRVALRWRRTKIVATLGPASSDRKMIEKLLRAGVDVVRLNMSHGTHEAHREVYANVRAVAQKLDVPASAAAMAPDSPAPPSLRTTVASHAGHQVKLRT